MTYCVVLPLLAVTISSPAFGQAFGVRQGDPVSKYLGEHAAGIANPTYYKIKVPEPNNEFESYAAVATPQTGICRVTGLGKTHYEDYGAETRSAFMSLKDALSSRYGRANLYDFLRTGALWDEPREWGWSIYKKERTLAAIWVASSGASLPQGISGVMLEVKAIAPSKTYVVLSYEFTNFEKCKALTDQTNNQGL
jgi:hypothetical protein